MAKNKNNNRKIIDEEQEPKKKLPVLALVILIILITISILFILLALAFLFYSLLFSDKSNFIFGVVFMIPSLLVLIPSILTIKRNNWARHSLIGILTFFSFYVAGALIGSIIDLDALFGLLSFLTLIIFVGIIYYFGNNKQIKGVFKN